MIPTLTKRFSNKPKLDFCEKLKSEVHGTNFNPLHLSEYKTKKEAWPILTMRQFTQETKQGNNSVLENTAPRVEIDAILDHQFVSPCRGGYYKFLVQWKNHPNLDSVWLQAAELQRLHPHLFTTYLQHNLPESSSSGEPAIDAN